jgi:hypothetical protein
VEAVRTKVWPGWWSGYATQLSNHHINAQFALPACAVCVCNVENAAAVVSVESLHVADAMQLPPIACSVRSWCTSTDACIAQHLQLISSLRDTGWRSSGLACAFLQAYCEEHVVDTYVNELQHIRPLFVALSAGWLGTHCWWFASGNPL